MEGDQEPSVNHSVGVAFQSVVVGHLVKTDENY